MSTNILGIKRGLFQKKDAKRVKSLHPTDESTISDYGDVASDKSPVLFNQFFGSSFLTHPFVPTLFTSTSSELTFSTDTECMQEEVSETQFDAKVEFDQNGELKNASYTTIKVKPEFEHDVREKKLLQQYEVGCASPYMSAEQAANYRIFPGGNSQFKDINGNPLEDGSYLFVMAMQQDENGDPEIHCYASTVLHQVPEGAESSPSTLKRARNHPDFTAGESVIFAGFIEIADGLLQEVSNNSGHYKLTREESFLPLGYLMRSLNLEELSFYDFSTIPSKGVPTIVDVESNLSLTEIIFTETSTNNVVSLGASTDDELWDELDDCNRNESPVLTTRFVQKEHTPRFDIKTLSSEEGQPTIKTKLEKAIKKRESHPLPVMTGDLFFCTRKGKPSRVLEAADVKSIEERALNLGR